MTGEQLNQLRVRLGMKRKTMARLLEVHPNTLSRWCSETNMDLPRYMALACSALLFELPPYGASQEEITAHLNRGKEGD